MNFDLLSLFYLLFAAKKYIGILLIPFIIIISGQKSLAGSKIECKYFLFSGEVEASTPAYLLLKEKWFSKRKKIEAYKKRGLEWKIEDYNYSDKIRFYSKEVDSLSNTIEFIPEKGFMTSYDLTPYEQDFVGRSYIGGTPASIFERNTRREELEQILDFYAGYRRHIKIIIDRFGKEKQERIYKDLRQETNERTIRFLIAEGVMLEVLKDKDGLLPAQILGLGDHRLNKKAAQIEQAYEDQGGVFIYRVEMDHQSSHSGLKGEVRIRESSFLRLDPKNVDLGHELRHARNYYDGSRYFGSAIADKGSELPGNSLAYNKFQSLEEPEPQSYSIRKDAQTLLGMLKSGKLANYDFYEHMFYNYSFRASIVAERNTIITNLLDKALLADIEPLIKKEKTRGYGEYKDLAHFNLKHRDQSFKYKLIIHDIKIKTKEQQLAYIRSKVDELILLNPNYVAQFRVVEQATELLVSIKSAREKAAVLEGIISITRPHFWDAGNFVVVKEADLIQRFNSVVSDRWIRFVHLPNKL